MKKVIENLIKYFSESLSCFSLKHSMILTGASLFISFIWGCAVGTSPTLISSAILTTLDLSATPPVASINVFTNNQVANDTITDTLPSELVVSGECEPAAPGWPVQVISEAVVGATNGVVKAVTNAATCGALQQNATNTSITNSFWSTTFTRTGLSELQAANMRAQFYARTANTAGVTSHSATTNQLFVEPDIESVGNNIGSGVIVFEDIAQIGDTCRILVAFSFDAINAPNSQHTYRVNSTGSTFTLASTRISPSGGTTSVFTVPNRFFNSNSIGIASYEALNKSIIQRRNSLGPLFLTVIYANLDASSNNTYQFFEANSLRSQTYEHCRVIP